MIENLDRSGYFGASDTSKVVADNRNTKSWQNWWSVKTGETEPDFSGNKYTEAGNRYEHPILTDITEEMNLDRQIIIEKYKLRVNYDGDCNGTIYEVKTHKSDKPFEVSTNYWRQAQVEMFVYKTMQDEMELPPFKRLFIVSYPLFPDEYYRQDEEVFIESSRVKFTEVKYDKRFIKDVYKPKLKYLAKCLEKGKLPK